jgi:hypothetical protein
MKNAFMRLSFLKPTARLIGVFAALMGVSSFLRALGWHLGWQSTGHVLGGLPLGFYPLGTPELGGSLPPFLVGKFIFNGIFWYVIASAVIWARKDEARTAFAKMALVFGGIALLLVISFGGYRYGDLKIALVVLGTAIFIGIQQNGRNSAV